MSGDRRALLQFVFSSVFWLPAVLWVRILEPLLDDTPGKPFWWLKTWTWDRWKRRGHYWPAGPTDGDWLWVFNPHGQRKVLTPEQQQRVRSLPVGRGWKHEHNQKILAEVWAEA